jgi:hypothetical protein
LRQEVAFTQYFGECPTIKTQPEPNPSTSTVENIAHVEQDAVEEEEQQQHAMLCISESGKAKTDLEQNVDNVLVYCDSDTAEALTVRGWNRPLTHWQQAKDRQCVGTQKLELPPALQRCSTDKKFRTRLCQHWDSSLGCKCPMKIKGKCDFAHGPIELRVKESKLNRWGIKDAEISEKEKVSEVSEELGDEHVSMEMREILMKGLSGGEDTYGAARNVEKIRKEDGKDEVEKRKKNSAASRLKNGKKDFQKGADAE